MKTMSKRVYVTSASALKLDSFRKKFKLTSEKAFEVIIDAGIPRAAAVLEKAFEDMGRVQNDKEINR
jgi:hypothetical protein